MRGRVAALTLLLLFSLSARPQCTLAPVYSAPFRSSILDLAADNASNDLWAATSYGVSLYDRSADPPRLVASLPIAGTTKIIRLANGIAYAGSGSTIAFIRKTGSTLQVFRTIDAGGTVNDLVVTPLSIFAATSNGLQQIDLLSFAKQTIPTSASNVQSLAYDNVQTLYAADGDSSVEKFTIGGPIVQSTGTLIAVPSSQIVRLNNGRIYVSDRLQSTAIFTEAGTKLITVNAPFTALAPQSGDVVWIGTNDTRVHAVDFSTAGTPVEVFEQSIPASGGSINRISSVIRAGNRLYAGGGDLGLLTWDITGFGSPFPIHSYNDAATTSIVAHNDAIYVSRATAIYEYKISSSGGLTEARHWDNRTHTVWDASPNGLLLTTTGTTAIIWAIDAITPSALYTISLGVSPNAAVMSGTSLYVLSSRALFTTDFTASPPVVTQINLQGMKPSWMARAGNSIALAEETANGTTVVRLLTNGVLGAPVEIAGVPPAGIAAQGSTVALFTYLGLTLIDFSQSPASISLIPGSTSSVALPQDLAFNGSTLLEMTDTSVLAWNTATRTLLRKFFVPAQPVAIHGGDDPQRSIAAVATASGEALITLSSPTPSPSLFASYSGNSYYKKASVAGRRMLLFDGRAADIFETTAEPRWSGSIRAGGLLDVAAAESALYSLTSGGTVTRHSLDGTPLAVTTVSEGSDSIPLSIRTVAGAPWISLSLGCLTTGCTKKTYVLDPKSLAVTATMTGGITDVAWGGSTAYALTDMPAEIRVIDVTNPNLPGILRSRTVEGAAPATSIAQSGGTIYVIADKLYAYSETSLTGSSQALPFASDPAAQIRAAGNCGIMAGRTFGPLLYSLPAFSSQPAQAVPAPVQSFTAQNGMVFIVTDDSLEIWSATALTSPARRRTVR